MGKEFSNRAGTMGLHTRNDVGQVRDGIDAVLFARRDERIAHGKVVIGILVADEEKSWIFREQPGADPPLRGCCREGWLRSEEIVRLLGSSSADIGGLFPFRSAVPRAGPS